MIKYKNIKILNEIPYTSYHFSPFSSLLFSWLFDSWGLIRSKILYNSLILWKTFEAQQAIPMFATELESDEAQMPFSYYYLDFCNNSKGEVYQNAKENLGSVILGESY